MVRDSFALNACVMSEQAMQEVQNLRLVVVGAGGLGGFVAQGLVRLGAQNIAVIDGDDFSDSNLNRQFFCNSTTLGKPKAEVCVAEMLQVDPEGKYKAIKAFITEKNVSYLHGFDFVFDCADNVKTKLLLESYCVSKGIILIHAGVNGNFGQTAIIDGKPILSSLFRRETKSRNSVILPQITAGLQLNLFVQYLNKTYQKNRLYLIDLQTMQISDIKY